MRVASAPVSFGIFELTADDAGLPDPVAVLDAMVGGGLRPGTELGPPGYFGDAGGTAEALAERNLALVGSFLPMRLSRREHTDEDFAFLDNARRPAGRDDAGGDARGRLVLISDAFCEPDRMAGAGRIEQLPATWLSRRAIRPAGRRTHTGRPSGAASAGTRPAFHYHGGTYVETPREIDRFAERIDRRCSGCASTAGIRCSAAAIRWGSSTPTASWSRTCT